jgi:cytochrome P450 family 110
MNDPETDSASSRSISSLPIKLPPGPKGSWLPTLKLIRNPRAALERWVRDYGDPFLLNALNGPVVITGREELLRVIHGQDPKVYAPFATATIVPLMGAGSMLVLDGEPHRRERRLVMPMFHGDRMKAYGESMQQTALEQFQRYQQKPSIMTLELMTDISLEVIVRTIFGGDNRAQADAMIAASRDVVAKSNPLLFFSCKTHVRFFGFSPWDRFMSARARLFKLFDAAIDERRSKPESGDDILSLLCNATYENGQPITREHICEELMTFLFAGHETTALSLTWAMYHLHQNPEALSALKQELDALPDLSPSSLSSAGYLKAVVQETLRIHPIVTETLRKLKEPIELGEFVLPAGFAVAPATVLAHHNAASYEDPESFKPERFLGRTYSPFQYMPFGGGHRRCIGAAFASYEMTMVLGVLLKQFDFALVDSAPVVPKRRSVTIGPSTGVPIFLVSERG